MVKQYQQSIADQIIILVMAFLIITAFATQILYYAIIPWFRDHLIDAVMIVGLTILVFYLIFRGAKSVIEYFGHGAGTWIIDVIHAIKGNDISSAQRKQEPKVVPHIYDADPQDVKDAIEVLVSMGWKKSEATQKVMSIVVKYPLAETDDVSKIVKKAILEGNL